MAGMDMMTGRVLSGVDHIRQSVADILTTPLGSQLWRPEYGSLLPRAVDQPMTPAYLSWVAHEAALRLRRWEDRWTLRRAKAAVERGRLLLSLDGVLTESGQRYLIGVEVAR